MIDTLSVMAPVAFILAICALIAAAVIFIKADVPRAYRFLRHKPHPALHSEQRPDLIVGQGLAPAANASPSDSTSTVGKGTQNGWGDSSTVGKGTQNGWGDSSTVGKGTALVPFLGNDPQPRCTPPGEHEPAPAAPEPPTRFLPADESSRNARMPSVGAQMSSCAPQPGTSPSVGAHAIFMRTPNTLSESGKEPSCLN